MYSWYKPVHIEKTVCGENIILIHEALANRWSLVSHMVSVRPLQKRQGRSKNKTKTRDNAIYMGSGGSLNSQDLFEYYSYICSTLSFT